MCGVWVAHGIDQSADSLARFRLSRTETAATAATATRAVTDGGVSASGHESGESGRTLAERWPSARSAGAVGAETRARECGHEEPDTCPLCATETEAPEHTVSGEVPIPETAEAAPASRESEGFDRPPEWRPESVVQTASGEETEIGSPGGVEYGQVMFREDRKEVLGLECSLCGEYVFRPDHPEPDSKHFAFHLKSEHKEEIAPGVAYDEYVVCDEEPESEAAGGEEEAEPERESDGDGEPQLASEVSRSIEELVRVQGVESVPSVLGRLGMDPSHREAVADVIEECR